MEIREQYRWLRELGVSKHKAVFHTLFSPTVSILYHYSNRAEEITQKTEDDT